MFLVTVHAEWGLLMEHPPLLGDATGRKAPVAEAACHLAAVNTWPLQHARRTNDQVTPRVRHSGLGLKIAAAWLSSIVHCATIPAGTATDGKRTRRS